MDAELGTTSLSQSLLSRSSTSWYKNVKVFVPWVCTLGLFLMIGALVSCSSNRNVPFESTNINLQAPQDEAKVYSSIKEKFPGIDYDWPASEKFDTSQKEFDWAAYSAEFSSLIANISALDIDGRKDKAKKVKKEGGKRGVEIEGACDLGGTGYFCTLVDEPEGEVMLLMDSVEAMNAKPDPGSEERKGCSGHVGKMVFSINDDQVAAVAYVPTEKAAEVDKNEWLQSVIGPYNGTLIASTTDGRACGRIEQNLDKGIFPLKIRDDLVRSALDFLRAKKLFPEARKDDESSDILFGDDYEPPEYEEGAAPEAPEGESAAPAPAAAEDEPATPAPAE